MKFEYEDAKKELFKKYDLECVDARKNSKTYFANMKYLCENNCYIELYAYAWKANPKNTSLRYNCKPVFGRIYVNSSHETIFAEYDSKRPGKIKKEIDFTIRYYATSYLEAVQGYNELIDNYLKTIRKIEDWANSYRIEK